MLCLSFPPLPWLLGAWCVVIMHAGTFFSWQQQLTLPSPSRDAPALWRPRVEVAGTGCRVWMRLHGIVPRSSIAPSSNLCAASATGCAATSTAASGMLLRHVVAQAGLSAGLRCLSTAPVR